MTGQNNQIKEKEHSFKSVFFFMHSHLLILSHSYVCDHSWFSICQVSLIRLIMVPRRLI